MLYFAMPSLEHASVNHYPFPALTDLDTIRLFRLTHSEKENDPLSGELFEYHLRGSNTLHLYEALSYTWGSQDTPESVTVDDKVFAITSNLHSALVRLRNHTFDRVIWVDAICINQRDDAEKQIQIPHMANIYRKASRVIVDLGPATSDASQALEDLRVAAEGTRLASEDVEKTTDTINLLLKRPYFLRTWVLQELAAARQILIMYGSVEIEGQAFCTGLKVLDLPNADHADLRALIPSAIYLIREAIYRPKSGWSSENSLRLRPLGELIDMYHAHKAYKIRDRVYAMLGMSTDGYNAKDASNANSDSSIMDGSNTGLIFPTDKIPWNQIMERLVRFTLSPKVSVKAAVNKPIAGITGKAVVFGLVHSVVNDDAWTDRMKVRIAFPALVSEKIRMTGQSDDDDKSPDENNNNATTGMITFQNNSTTLKPEQVEIEGRSPNTGKSPNASLRLSPSNTSNTETRRKSVDQHEYWTLSVPAKTIRANDIVCLFEGSSNATIVRPYQDYFEILMISATNLDALYPKYINEVRSILILRDFILLWDWDNFLDETKPIKNDQSLDIFPSDMLKDESKFQLDGANIALDQAHILMEFDRGKDAEDMVKQARDIYDTTYGKSSSQSIAALYDLLAIHIRTHKHYDRQDSVWQDIRARISVQGPLTLERLRSIERLASASESAGYENLAKYFRRLAAILCDHEDSEIPESDVVNLAEACDDNMFLLLLVEGGSKVRVTENVFKAAVYNVRSKDTMLLTLLLEERGKEFKITEDIVKEAISYGSNIEILKYLVQERGHEFSITEDVFKEMVEILDTGRHMIEFLLDERGVDFKVTENMVKNAAAQVYHVEELMELLFDKRGNEFKVTDDVAQAICDNGGLGRIIFRILDERAGDGFEITEEMVLYLAKDDVINTHPVLEKLFNARNTDVPITEKIVKTAATNWKYQEILLHLLMSNAASRGQLSEDLVEAAASGGLTLGEDGTWSFDKAKRFSRIYEQFWPEVRAGRMSIEQGIMKSKEVDDYIRKRHEEGHVYDKPW